MISSCVLSGFDRFRTLRAVRTRVFRSTPITVVGFSLRFSSDLALRWSVSRSSRQIPAFGPCRREPWLNSPVRQRWDEFRLFVCSDRTRQAKANGRRRNPKYSECCNRSRRREVRFWRRSSSPPPPLGKLRKCSGVSLRCVEASGRFVSRSM